MNPSTFQIYDASAGSGKTYTLVKEYLKRLFASSSSEPYKQILAITFTNKAVTEMKERIVSNLRAFASPDIINQPTDMFKALCDELRLEPEQLHERSKNILQSLVHNYAAFDVSTIDKFTQKLIRTFALDLRLPINFEVELNTDDVLSKAINNLISKAGTDKQLTRLLVDFAIEKADDDKSFNIEGDFMPIAKLITTEGNSTILESLRHKTISDFKTLKSDIIIKIRAAEDQIINESKRVLSLIEERGLEFSDFSSGYLPKHFHKLSLGNFNVSFTPKWQENLENSKLYPARVSESIADLVNGVQPQISTIFQETKILIIRRKFLKAIYKNLTPLSVLNEINKEVDAIKQEENILLISEFNPIVSQHIKTQPVPYIYERIGEKYKHYFIDEFQDTSVMQWENLIPLIQNALSGENASALIVGDAKQSIYRWRGGKAEQFIDLSNSNTSFPVKSETHSLDQNYRSAKVIIEFNNSFFSHISNRVFSNELHKSLYTKSKQAQVKSSQGYVNMTFLDFDENVGKNEEYSKQVLTTVLNCLENGFALEDITILVRKNKEGVAIANYFIENSTIRVISSESLLLSNSPEVNFIIDLLKLSLDKHNKQLKVDVLGYLAEYKLGIENKHAFFHDLIHLETESLFKTLESYRIYFNLFEATQLPLYETIETIIHDFTLVKTSNAYVQFFLDFVYDYTNSSTSGLSQFIEHYENKKDKLSIIVSEKSEGVQIMTIHKAKGLEFPIVIFPYANVNIYEERNYKVWYKLDPAEFFGYPYALINYNKDLESFGEQGHELYTKRQSELELDNINILYVGLTRAVEQLYIISEKPKSKSDNLKTFSDLFMSYLKYKNIWSDHEANYSFGHPEKIVSKTEPAKNAVEQKCFISTPIKRLNIALASNARYLWDIKLQDAIEKGNLIHLIMSQVITPLDIDFVFNNFERAGVIGSPQKETLKTIVQNIVTHPDIKSYFNSNDTIYTEKEILTQRGETLIPDRVIITNTDTVVILDYKSGEPKGSHISQIKGYKNAIEEMGLSVYKMVLVYINETINVKEV